MEEILASIRRIISEEEQAPQEPLDLTQAAEPEPPLVDDDLVFEASPAPPPVAAAPEPLQPATAPAPAPVMAATPAAPADAIISQPTASAAADALSRLAGSLRIADTPGQSIEGVVRELLKPMLKDWLDQHLPAIVESRVEAELERIARLAR